MPDTNLPPLYDEGASLRQLARHRLKRDELTVTQVALADALAGHIQQYFSAEETETAGRAILIASASAGGLLEQHPDVPPAVLLNILGFTAARLVTDGRAWLDAQDGTS